MADRMGDRRSYSSESPNNDYEQDHDSKKRLRCSNFSSQERNILIHIIEKYQDILECKKLDKTSVMEREAIWDGIAQEYNDILLNEPVRTTRQLKQCYENIKRKIRKEQGCSFEETNLEKITIKPMAVLRTQLRPTQILTSDDSNSSTHLHGQSSSFQGSVGRHSPVQYHPESFPMSVYGNVNTDLIGDELRRKNACIDQLQRTLLSKQIDSVNLDLEMKTKKYELELKVEQAKLEYYKRKCEYLSSSAVKTESTSNGKI